MAARSSDDKLIVIVGETASGKSTLGVELAERFNGEIICADSRTVYKSMDIGTAKPSVQDQKRVPHHLLDVVEPDQSFTVADFKRLTNETIDDISRRGKLPIMVGGSGLYIDAVLFDYQFSPPGARRDLINPRHLKYQESTAYQAGPRPNTLILGFSLPKDILQSKIEQRVTQMFKDGLEQEAKGLAKKYGWDVPGLNTIGYQEFRPYIKGEQTLDETRQQVERNTILYAKRQRTWFKRNKGIQWIDDPRKAINVVKTFLNKKQ